MTVAGRIVYHLHSLGAAGAARTNPDVGAGSPSDRGLARLEPWLDHVRALGCGAVLLTPIFVSSTHGYDTVDPFRIDQRLGDEDDLARFVDACRARDLRLVLDGVFNHVGRGFPAFQDVVAHGEASPFANWFRLDFSRDDGDGFGYRTFEGHRELVALDHRSPEVLAWAVDVACHWLDRGADGWRLDVAYAIPTDFLAAFVVRVRERHPDAFLFGEMIHGDYAAFVAASGLDSVTQYELHKAIWSSLNDANLFELAWSLKRHRELVGSFAPVTFVGNHDVSRIASQLHDRRHLAHALAILCTVPGIPCLYYGDEWGWEGAKTDGAGGDDPMRGPLPEPGAPVSPGAASVLELHRRAIAVRRDRPWLTRADLEIGELANRRMTLEVSAPEGRLLTILDTDAGATDPPPGWRPILTEPGVTIAEPA
jgi:cyclomaltodextrinase